MYVHCYKIAAFIQYSTVGIHYIVTVTALQFVCHEHIFPTVFLPFTMTLAAETRAAYRSVLREFARSVRAESPSSKHWSVIKFIFAVNSSSWQEE